VRAKLGAPNSDTDEWGTMALIPLRRMLSGQKGVISKVKANGELGRRIRDMGLVPGTPVEIQGRAPLKDPVAIRVRDFILTLRNNEADFILVEVNETS
jgi:ferrous iron transport protein A